MKKFLLLVLVFFVALPLGSGFSGDDAKPDKPKVEKPQLGDKDDAAIQNRRYLKIRNETADTLSVSLQFRTLENEVWTWIPADPSKDGEAITFDIEAGQEMDVKYKDQPLAASRMRIWATSPTQKWLKYKSKDTWLVPERNDDNEHIYLAPAIETYYFNFSSTKDKGAIPGDADVTGEQYLPTEGENIAPPPPDIIWDDVPDPLPPDFPYVRDLAVLPVFVTGVNATVRVKNLGHFSKNIGRRLMVQKIAPGSMAEDKGPIGTLYHHSVKPFYLIGLAPGNYIAFVTPNDDSPYDTNDKRNFTIGAAMYTDAAVLPPTFIAGKVHLKVKNVGTAPIPMGAPQILKVMKLPAGAPMDQGPLGPLGVNGIRPFAPLMLAPGNYKAFIAPNDPAPFQFNDEKIFSVAASPFHDLDVLPIAVSPGKATIKIKNIGTADAPAGPVLKTMKLPGGPTTDHGPIGLVTIGNVKTFPNLPFLPGNYKAFISPGDAPPHHGNDSELFTIPTAPDLAAMNLAKVGANVKGIIKNNGPGAFPGGSRNWHIEKMMGAMWTSVAPGVHVVPFIGPGGSHPIQGNFTGAGTYRIRITPADGTPGNDTTVKMLP